jgi:hypothetical protein
MYQWLSVAIAVVHLKGYLEVVDSLTGTGFRITHQAEVRMSVQPPEKDPESRRGHWLRKHAEGDAQAKGLWFSRQEAQETGRQQRENQPMKKEGWTPSKLEEVLRPKAHPF